MLQSWKESLGDAGDALRVVKAYLDVYSAKGEAGRGLPQGGSLSVVLANLVLCAADAEVLKSGDEELFYARYCDDVIFAHPNEEKCRAALAAYERSLNRLDLPMHSVKSFKYGREYYEIKSKGPFRWAPDLETQGVAPWVSFLGSQIKYDGETRIRRESVERHVRSLGRETSKAVREITSEAFARKDAAEVRKWFGRFRNRLIARGVGYVTAKYEDCIGCWAKAFGQVTRCDETRLQMRYLDRVRERMLCKVWNMVAGRIGEGRRRYKGRPFSYHEFLTRKFSRPTNLRRKPRPVRYSEL